MKDVNNYRLVDNFGNSSNFNNVALQYAVSMAREYLRLGHICSPNVYKYWLWKQLPDSHRFSLVCVFEYVGSNIELYNSK